MMKKLIKKIPLTACLYGLCAMLFCALVYLFIFNSNAKSTGGMIGKGTGTLVGRAIGSLEGLTVGQKEGFYAGKAAGLSAEDTTAELSGTIQEVERLQVLVASGTFSHVLSIGDAYAALLSMKYNAVFTVNLSTAEIELREDGLHILLDQPQVDFIPVGEVEKAYEYKSPSLKDNFFDSTEAGYDAFNNSVKQMKQEATNKLAGDDSMLAAARTSAVAQLKQLVNAVSLSKPAVLIEFRDLRGTGK